MTLAAGQTIGAYRIVEQIGRGGMATVYKAHQAALARYVAVKVLPAYLADDPTFRERFQAEAVTIAKLRHPNILQVFDFGEEAGLHYIVTEFVDGGTLAEQLGKPLPADYVVKVLTPIASAVDYAHAREVLHRDIKPANVLLARDGTPVVSDFGLARMMGSIERLTRTGAVVGTPEYMAPEQASGENAGPPADRYAVAIVAYEMLVGSVPYSADTPLATLIAHLHKPLPLPTARNPLLSPALEAVLLKGLAKDPADRHETAAAFVRALEAAERGLSPSAVAAVQPSVATLPRPEPAPPVAIPLPGAPVAAVSAPAARRGLPLPLLAGAGLLALALAGGAVFALTREGAPPPGPPADTSASRSAVPKGDLIWQAALDGTTGEMNTSKAGDETATAVRTPPGAIELEVLKAGTSASVTIAFRRQLPTNYVAEFTFKVRPQSALNVNFGIRNDSATQRRHSATVNVGSELLDLSYFEFGKQPPGAQVVSGRVAVPRLQSGREVILAVVAHAKGYAVYLDGQLVIPEVADDRLATFASTLSVSAGGGPGLLTISGVRVYSYTGTETVAAPGAAPAAPAGGTPAATGTCTPAVGGTNVMRECRFSGLPPGGTATFAMSQDGGATRAPPGGQTVESDGSVTFRIQPGITGRFVVTATAGGVSRSLSFEAR